MQCLTGGLCRLVRLQSDFTEKVVARIRVAKRRKQAERLLLDGPQGYPDEEDFAYIAAEAGFSFAVVQVDDPPPTHRWSGAGTSDAHGAAASL